jgi:hypothetical protein
VRPSRDKWGFVAVSSTYGSKTTASSETEFFMQYTDDEDCFIYDFQAGFFNQFTFNVAVNSY